MTGTLLDNFLEIVTPIYKGCDVDAPEFGCLVTDVLPTEITGAVWFVSDYGYAFRVNILTIRDVKIIKRYAYGLDEA